MWPRRKAARMLLRILLRPDSFRGCCCGRGCGGGRRAVPPLHSRPIVDPRRSSLFVDTRWDGRGGRRLCGRDCADDCGGRRARTFAHFWLSNQGRLTLPQHFLCVLCPVLDSRSVKRFFRTRPDGRKIFSDTKARSLSNKKNLALRCHFVPRHSSVFATPSHWYVFYCKNT